MGNLGGLLLSLGLKDSNWLNPTTPHTGNLTPDQIKARLMKTASKSFPRSSIINGQLIQYDMFTVGAGYLDLDAAIRSSATPRRGRLAASPKAVAQRREKGRQWLHPQVPKQVRKHARDRKPVFEGIAGAGWRLRAVGHHPPAAIGSPRQICSVDM